jgi:hypothetical protein
MPKLVAENITSEKFQELSSKPGQGDLESGGSAMAQMARTGNNPVTVEYTGITYSIKVGKGDQATMKTILSNLSGKLNPGTMTAIMG